MFQRHCLYSCVAGSDGPSSFSKAMGTDPGLAHLLSMLPDPGLGPSDEQNSGRHFSWTLVAPAQPLISSQWMTNYTIKRNKYA